ncbi:hypothetical protein KV205_25845 [Streptomyces sp. SKN60]|uniref:hypothetical protein n=1 Tax=Streptomyces sp. SKN60 TaxID=2855506 RepID=UPI0022474769|nr:hypothetical protein [Streptomyces sp. SKN60]MCX2183929.1 hypothetical protein [Streptomyces sp. SKN60]
MTTAPDGPGERSPDYGPGVSWLAERTGRPPAELLADPAGIVAAVTSATRACLDIAAGIVSEDPAVRADAELRRTRLLARFDRAPTPGAPLAARAAAALRAAADHVRDTESVHDGPAGRGDQR